MPTAQSSTHNVHISNFDITCHRTVSEELLEPSELVELGPRDLSFYVASFFSDVKLLQQNVGARWHTTRACACVYAHGWQ